jgi:hypothetical protein
MGDGLRGGTGENHGDIVFYQVCSDKVSFIEELHRKKVKAGESFGAAYVVGWFDDIPQMQQVYDRYRGKSRIVVAEGRIRLE